MEKVGSYKTYVNIEERITMTKQHFRALADAISNLDLDYNDREHVAEEMAKVCAKFNSAFKTDLFLYAARGGLK
jgi:23S rRNA C2498 (ribose-2'-O)-methylase RlmM